MNKGSEEKDKKKTPSYIDKRLLIKKIVISILLIIIAIIIPIITMFIQARITISYKEQSNLDYMVYLKKNNYYETLYLGKDMHYIAGLIDYIYINFNYNFKINENINYDYKYYVEAELAIFERNKPNNVIFSKKDILVEDILESNIDSNEFSINADLRINYDEYNNLVKWFKADYNISADSNLKITLYIKTNGVYEKYEYPIAIKNSMDIIIPLTEQMINISMDYRDINNIEETVIIPNTELINNISFVSSGIFGLLAIISVIKLIIFIFKVRGKRSFYDKSMGKILKNYDRVIVELKSMLPLQNVIDVISFEELLDVSDRLSKPILLTEVDRNKKSWFIVKNGEEVYRYILEDVNPKPGD